MGSISRVVFLGVKMLLFTTGPMCVWGCRSSALTFFSVEADDLKKLNNSLTSLCSEKLKQEKVR